MKKLLIWTLKKFVDKDTIKSAIHSVNAELAKREVGEASAKVMAISSDIADTMAVYLESYGDDGKISEAELGSVNTACDALVDKYVSDDAIPKILEKVLG